MGKNKALAHHTGDALDTLYDPNAVVSRFLWSASITFFLSFPFLASSSCLVSPRFSCLFSSFLSFFVFWLPCLFLPFLVLFSFLCFFFPNDLCRAYA